MSKIETPRSKVILPLFFLVFFGGGLLGTAGGVYLYLNWEKHFPPMAKLQDQVKAARGFTEEDEAAQENLEKPGVTHWMDGITNQYTDLNDQYTARAEESANRMEDDLIKSRASHPPALIEPIPAEDKNPDLAAPENQVAVQQPSATQEPAKPAEEPATEVAVEPATNPDGDPLTGGGTIEKMEKDWLPPGVTRTK